MFIKSHPTVQFDIQTLVRNKCKGLNDAHTATVMKLLSIFTLFSHKNLFLFNICSENYKCSTHKKTWKLKLRRKNVLWLSFCSHVLERTNPSHRKRIQSLLINFLICCSKYDSLCPSNRHWNELTHVYPMYIHCVSLSLVKCWPRGGILLLD